MTSSPGPLNRFFVCADYSVFYRRLQKLNWQNQTTSDYAMLSVINGGLDYTMVSIEGQLVANQGLVLEPNSAIQVQGNQVDFLFLTFRSALVIQHAVTMQLVPAESTVSFSQTPVETSARLRSLFGEFTSELLSENPGKEIVMRALVDQVLVEALRNYARTKRSAELELSRVGIIDRRIRRSVELMYTQVDQDLSLSDLAAASYLSTFHFARLFKKITGVTPHNYLASIRATRAQLLLAESDLSITQIAARVGYLSASHFTKAFRAATGTTPREFRNALIQRCDT